MNNLREILDSLKREEVLSLRDRSKASIASLLVVTMQRIGKLEGVSNVIRVYKIIDKFSFPSLYFIL
jgi:hypothetical protein